MGKLQWESLPPSRVAAIEDLTGPVLKAESVTGGLMPGLAAVLHAGNGRYFLKAVPASSPAASLYEREMSANTFLPEGVPAPRMQFCSGAEGWLVMVFDYLDARDADLSPGSPDLAGVLATLGKIGTMAAGGAVPVTQNVAALRDKAAALPGKHPGGHPWDMYQAAIDGFDDNDLAGGSLVHYDLHPGNIKVTTDGRVLAVDWGFACSGAPWIDAALLIPRLIEAGHSPASAERLMSQIRSWHAALPSAVTALGALWTMFREYKALHGPMDGRAFRAQAARAGRAWIAHRMN
jgi:aminoglycoside phosphotransferase (APT) family kinase protein